MRKYITMGQQYAIVLPCLIVFQCKVLLDEIDLPNYNDRYTIIFQRGGIHGK